MRAILLAQLVLVLSALAGCSDGSTSDNPSGDQNATVTVKDFNFNPTTVNVLKGSTVTWTNEGQMEHSVTGDDDSWGAGDIEAGEDVTYTFEHTGGHPYHCKYHPAMTGTINVAAA
jgi:plastocyanin